MYGTNIFTDSNWWILLLIHRWRTARWKCVRAHDKRSLYRTPKFERAGLRAYHQCRPIDRGADGCDYDRWTDGCRHQLGDTLMGGNGRDGLDGKEGVRGKIDREQSGTHSVYISIHSNGKNLGYE
jgi:hypothetical protein